MNDLRYPGGQDAVAVQATTAPSAPIVLPPVQDHVYEALATFAEQTGLLKILIAAIDDAVSWQEAARILDVPVEFLERERVRAVDWALDDLEERKRKRFGSSGGE